MQRVVGHGCIVVHKKGEAAGPDEINTDLRYGTGGGMSEKPASLRLRDLVQG